MTTTKKNKNTTTTTKIPYLFLTRAALRASRVIRILKRSYATTKPFSNFWHFRSRFHIFGNFGPDQILFMTVQYVVLGPRIKIIILNILCESNRHELKFSLKISFMLLTIISKWQAQNGNIFLVIRKKGDRARGSLVRECSPWSANHTSRTKSPDNFRTMMRILTMFYLFFIILDISKLQSC